MAKSKKTKASSRKVSRKTPRATSRSKAMQRDLEAFSGIPVSKQGGSDSSI